LKDIWGLPNKEVERVALWMAEALLDYAARQSSLKNQRGKSLKPIRNSSTARAA
jgi:hypothetical protein